MNLSLKVLKKQRVETGKGIKYALNLGDKKGNTLTFLVDYESDLDEYKISDTVIVKLSQPQQQLLVETKETDKEEGE